MIKLGLVLGIILYIISRVWTFITDDSTFVSNLSSTKGKLKLENTKCKHDDYIYLTGFVRNINVLIHSYIKAKGLLKEGQGNMLITETVYTVD